MYSLSCTLLAATAAFAGHATWDFEKDRGGWKPWGTTRELGDASSVVSLSTGNPRSGKQSLCISDPFDQGNPYAVFVASVDPARTYVFSGYLRAEGAGSAGQHVWVMPVNRSSQTEKAIKLAGTDGLGPFQVGHAWQRFQFTVPALTPDVTHLYLAIRPSAGLDPKWQGKIWADDLRFSPQDLRPVDLSAVANRNLSSSESGEVDLSHLKPGEWKIADLPFNLLDPVNNGGKSLLALRSSLRAALPVGTVCDCLYLLHTAAGAKPGSRVGSLVWEFADGSSISTPVTCGEQVGDFRNGRARNAFRQSCSALGQSPGSTWLFVAGLANPEPDKVVTRVILESADQGQSLWLVLAAIAGTGNNIAELAQAAARDPASWKPFAPGLHTSADPLLDLSYLLDAPAGKHGFVQSKAGHFVFEDGTPARFMAVNIHSHRGLLPSREEARRVARTLSRYGVNLVRLHLMEYALADPADPSRPLPEEAEVWDRFDYLVKCLKDRGVYVELDSISGLSAGRPGAGAFEGAADYPPHRAWWSYHPKLRELGQVWAKTLLMHRNRYTGNRLVDEPAVAMMMLVNEQSAFFDWKEGVKPTPPAIREIFSRRYNAWLLKTFQDRAGLEQAWRESGGASALEPGEDPAKGTVDCWELYTRLLTYQAPSDGAGRLAPARLRTLMRFLRELQKETGADYLAMLHGLGVKVPVAATNILAEPAELESCVGMDFTAQNMYYEHVKQAGKSLTFANIPEILQNPINSGKLVHPGIAAAKLNTLPLVSTEHDTMWPQEWRSTHNLSVYSMAAFQDWDAVFWYCYMGGYGLSWEDAESMTAIPFPTVQFNDAASAGMLPAAALLFHRRDVAPGRRLVQVVFDKARSEATGTRLRSGAFPWNYLTWVSRVEGVFGQPDGRAQFTVGPVGPRSLPVSLQETQQPPEDGARVLDARLKQEGLIESHQGLQDGRLVSDTGEIVRDWKNGLLLIDTPRTQAFSGFPSGPVRLRDVTVDLGISFATIAVQSLDDAPVVVARKLLLTAVARVENDRDTVAYRRTARVPNGAVRGEQIAVTPGSNRGRDAQARLEPVEATLSIAGGPLSMTPIAADGSALQPPVRCAVRQGRAQVPLGNHATIWYLLERP